MTLRELIPTLRSSLPHPLEPWLWPASTHHLPGGDLSVGGASLVGVAAEHGTPSYVLDLAEFHTRCATYRTTFHGAASRRDSAPYSLSSRNCTTSNCNGPTAASNGTRAAASRKCNTWITPSCSN